MRRLMVLRHAKTERAEPGERDRDRKLMKRGRADAPIVGAYLAHHGLAPDLALLSPAERAQETWRLVAAVLDKRPRAEIDERLYNASPQKLLEIIAEPRKARSLLIVGHNPSLQRVAATLSDSADACHAEVADDFPTAAAVLIELPAVQWRDVKPGTGRIIWFLKPKELDR